MFAHLLHRVISVRPLGGHLLSVRFDDGVEGDVDIRDVLGEPRGLLAPLADPAFVARASIDDGGTVAWPGDLDVDPILLYCAVKRIPVPVYDETPRKRRAKAGITRKASRARSKSAHAAPATEPKRRRSPGRRQD